MLPEAELGIVDYLKTSYLKDQLRAIDVLPDLEGKTLVSRMAADAPAVYVSLGNHFKISGEGIILNAGIACVGRNSRSPKEARHGDGKQIGMLQIVDAMMTLVDGCQIGDIGWTITGLHIMNDEQLVANGLHVGVVLVESQAAVPLPPAIDLDSLSDFLTHRTDYDIAPHATAAEHDKWLQEPTDHSTSAPELTDQQQLQP